MIHHRPGEKGGYHTSFDLLDSRMQLFQIHLELLHGQLGTDLMTCRRKRGREGSRTFFASQTFSHFEQNKVSEG
jgi:hypothetical protein